MCVATALTPFPLPLSTIRQAAEAEADQRLIREALAALHVLLLDMDTPALRRAAR